MFCSRCCIGVAKHDFGTIENAGKPQPTVKLGSDPNFQLTHSSVMNRAMLYSLRPASRRLFRCPRTPNERAWWALKRSRHHWVRRDRADFVLQALFHRGENKLADIAAE